MLSVQMLSCRLLRRKSQIELLSRGGSAQPMPTRMRDGPLPDRPSHDEGNWSMASALGKCQLYRVAGVDAGGFGQ